MPGAMRWIPSCAGLIERHGREDVAAAVRAIRHRQQMHEQTRSLAREAQLRFRYQLYLANHPRLASEDARLAFSEYEEFYSALEALMFPLQGKPEAKTVTAPYRDYLTTLLLEDFPVWEDLVVVPLEKSRELKPRH